MFFFFKILVVPNSLPFHIIYSDPNDNICTDCFLTQPFITLGQTTKNNDESVIYQRGDLRSVCACLYVCPYTHFYLSIHVYSDTYVCVCPSQI